MASVGDTDIVTATVNPAQVAVGPKGEVYVLYEKRVPLPNIQKRTRISCLSRSTDGGRNFSPSVLIADGAYERSRVAMTFSSDGTLYSAWRAKPNQFKGSYDTVRDVSLAFSLDDGLSRSSAVKVHDDRFKANDCPEITLGMDADSKGRLHVAWYTGTRFRPGIPTTRCPVTPGYRAQLR